MMSTKLQRMMAARPKRIPPATQTCSASLPSTDSRTLAVPTNSLLLLDLHELLDVPDGTLQTLLAPKLGNLLVIPDCVIGLMDDARKEAKTLSESCREAARASGNPEKPADEEMMPASEVRSLLFSQRAKCVKIRLLQQLLVENPKRLPIAVQSKSDLSKSIGSTNRVEPERRYSEQFVQCGLMFCARFTEKKLVVVTTDRVTTERLHQLKVDVRRGIEDLLYPDASRKREREAVLDVDAEPDGDDAHAEVGLELIEDVYGGLGST